MIQVNLSYDPPSSPLVVNWVLAFGATFSVPYEKVFVADLDLPSMTEQINAVVLFMKKSLYTKPAADSALLC